MSADRVPGPCRVPALYPVQYRDLVAAALREDLGRAGDRTSDAVVPAQQQATADARTRSAGVVAGGAVAAEVFRQLDPSAEIRIVADDGQPIPTGATLVSVAGNARALLAAERTAINLLSHLSGIATATSIIVEQLAGTTARVVGTRKTTPLLRALEAHAVRCGGGGSHRYGLDDAILIKDNHRIIAGSAAEAVRRARAAAGHLVKIEIEVDALDELEAVLALGVDAVLLDNMAPEALHRAVAIRDRAEASLSPERRTRLEASGGITPETARAVAETGVDLLSIGWLTHSAPALDIGLDFRPSCVPA